jgi:hypothetical protein
VITGQNIVGAQFARVAETCDIDEAN